MIKSSIHSRHSIWNHVCICSIESVPMIYLSAGDKYVLQDLLSVHMVRAVQSNTIISYHPTLRNKTAVQLRCLIDRTGDSVYWSKIFHKSKDPTCLFLCFLWYAMYEWDEVFEVLYTHITHLVSMALVMGLICHIHRLHRNKRFSTLIISGRHVNCTFCKRIYFTIELYLKISGSRLSLYKRLRTLRCSTLL